MDDLWHRASDILRASQAEARVRRLRDSALDVHNALVTADSVRDHLHRAATALYAAIRHHRPTADPHRPLCRTCGVAHPCPTRRAVSDALLPQGPAGADDAVARPRQRRIVRRCCGRAGDRP